MQLCKHRKKVLSSQASISIFVLNWVKHDFPREYRYEESDYSKVNTCDNEIFRSTILQHKKKLKKSTLQLPIYYIQL